MIDELSRAGREHLNADFVEAFDVKRGHPDPSGDLRLFTIQGLGSDSTLIDFGAGTGQFAVPAAKLFGRVIAVCGGRHDPGRGGSDGQVEPDCGLISGLRLKRRANCKTEALIERDCFQPGGRPQEWHL